MQTTKPPTDLELIEIKDDSGKYGSFSLGFSKDNSDFKVEMDSDNYNLPSSNLISRPKAMLAHPDFTMVIGFGEFDAFSSSKGKTFEEAKKNAEDSMCGDHVVSGEFGNLPFYTEYDFTGCIKITFPSPEPLNHRRIVLFSKESVEGWQDRKIALALFDIPAVQKILETLNFEGKIGVAENAEEDKPEAKQIDGEYLSLTLVDGWYLDEEKIENEYQS